MVEEPASVEKYRIRDLAELLLVFDPDELMGDASEIRIEDLDGLYILTRAEADQFMKEAVRDVRQAYGRRTFRA